MKLTTSPWPTFGRPSNYILTFQFEGRNTKHQYSFGYSDVWGSCVSQTGSMLSSEIQVCITCQQVADGTLDSIEALIAAVFVLNEAQVVWAICTVTGTDAVIHCLEKGMDTAIDDHPDPPNPQPAIMDMLTGAPPNIVEIAHMSVFSVSPMPG